MYGRILRSIASVVALATLVYGCSGAPGQLSAVPAGTGASVPATHFRAATSAERSQPRPSLSVGSKIAAKDSRGQSGFYTLITSLTTDDNLNFGEWTIDCVPAILQAPWYVALHGESLAIPTTTVNNCQQTDEQKVPTPTDFYIVQVGIGFFDLSVSPISGPATADGGTWTFTPMSKTTKFQADNIYAFFIASWSGTGTPPSVSI